MSIRKTLLAAFLAFTLTSPLASSLNAAKERLCLSTGQFAENIAKAKDKQMSFDEAMPKGWRDDNKTKSDRNAIKTMDMVGEFVYIMNLSPADAKKLVYLKCLSGEYSH